VRKVKEIRDAFSKGNVIISRRGVFIIYSDPSDNSWITQEFEGDYKSVFEELLNNADRFSISVGIHSGVSFRFIHDGEIDGDVDEVIFPSLEKEVTIEELRQRSASMPVNKDRVRIVGKILSDAFDGRDFTNDYDMAEGLSNWILALSEYDREPTVSFESLRTWENLRRFAKSFYGIYPKIGNMEFYAPTRDDPVGSVEIQISCDKDTVFEFPDKAKIAFHKMLYTADCVYIETGFIGSEVFQNITLIS